MYICMCEYICIHVYMLCMHIYTNMFLQRTSVVDSDAIHTMGQCCMQQNGKVSKLKQRKSLQISTFKKQNHERHAQICRQDITDSTPENYKEYKEHLSIALKCEEGNIYLIPCVHCTTAKTLSMLFRTYKDFYVFKDLALFTTLQDTRRHSFTPLLPSAIITGSYSKTVTQTTSGQDFGEQINFKN